MNEIEHFIDVDCYNCGSDRHTFYASENGFTLVRCLGCGLLYVTPRPTAEEIMQAHKCGVHQGDTKLEVKGYFSKIKYKNYLKIIEDFFDAELFYEEKTWLDIGCGYGEFIEALQSFSKNNIIAKGVEPNVDKQKSARKRGLDVSYFELNNHTAQYDFISLLNVFSHLPDPTAELTNWKRLLKDTGELFLETGDTANLNSKDHSRPFFLPDHLSFASEDIVVNMLEKIGFEIIDVKKYPAFKLSIVSILKEIGKVLWPNKTTQIKALFKKQFTDMYIRAKAK